MSSLKPSRIWEIILYPDNDSYSDALTSICNYADHYAFITHDADINDDGYIKKSHTHIVIWFENARKIETIYNSLHTYINDNINLINKCISLNSALRYLIHSNDKAKTQYKKSSIITSDKYKVDAFLPDVDSYTAESTIFEFISSFESQTENIINNLLVHKFCIDNGIFDYYKHNFYRFNIYIKSVQSDQFRHLEKLKNEKKL